MNVNDDGTVQLSTFKTEKLAEAEAFINLLIASGPKGREGGGKRDDRPPYVGPEPVEGETYKGKITGIQRFGVFLEFMSGEEDGSTPGLEGLCHVSELSTERVRSCEGYVKGMNVEEFDVIYLGINAEGKRQLSRKAVLEKKNGKSSKPIQSSPPPPPPTMSNEELDVIAKAIEGAQQN
jgi:polyribonucleotide nucleotidyltransferase